MRVVAGFLCAPFQKNGLRRSPHSPNAINAVNSRMNVTASTAGSVSPPSFPHHLIEGDGTTCRSYERVLDCVLKVFCTHCEPNYELPWAMTPQNTSTSSAFIIRGRRILTNAHSVEHHTSVKVKRRDSDTKYSANVIAIGNECDLALLGVEDEEFWRHFDEHSIHGQTHRAPYLTPGPLPHLQDSVFVIGYPSPGNQISVTAGVASRVEMQQYVHGQDELLTVQIDAAINDGNSGGPVINEKHQVVGIAFQSIDPSQADSVGYFIPYCIVQHFLDDIAYHKRYTGFPFSGFRWQRMESPYLRRAKCLSHPQSGILVKWVAETSDASRVLKKGDIVTHIDGVAVSNAGTVPFRAGERIGLDFLVTSKFSHDTVTVTFLRNGVRSVQSYQLSSMADHRLVPVHDARHARRQPEYIVYAGLVFQILSEPFLHAVYGDNWLVEAPVRLIDEYYRGTRTKSGKKEIVVLAQILATDSTSGYEDEESASDAVILRRINGQDVMSLNHVADLIDENPDDLRDIEFELEGDALIILDRAAAQREERSILQTHCIPAARALYTDIDR